MKIEIDTVQASAHWRNKIANTTRKIRRALSAALNMAASMIEEEGRTNIENAGKFGPRWTEGLKARRNGALDNMEISVTHDIPYAGIFEHGGEIHGSPFLWIGLSGTDAEGVDPREYGPMFSVNNLPGQKRPLLFSVEDKKPKYFGIESVTIPPKFRIHEAARSVMSNFRNLFHDALGEG